jgi:hypothetical protein
VNQHRILSLLLAAVAGCGSPEPPKTPGAEAEKAPEPHAAESASASASAEAPPATPAAEPTASEVLARDLLKAGGRRIGWSATKKRFIVPVDARSEGGRGLDLTFYDDEGQQRDIQRVCQPGECEDRLDEIIKELMPKLSSRLQSEGYESVASIGWPAGRDEIDVGTLGAKLRNDHGRFSFVRGSKTSPLRALGGRAPKGDPTVVYAVPSARLLGVLADGFFVFKLP